MKVQPPTDSAVDQWLAEAKPGDRLIYWRGDLVFDLKDSRRPAAERVALQRARDRLHAAYLEGLVSLTQEKAGENDRVYLATRRKPGRPLFTTA